MTMTVSDLDIFRSANLHLDQHGNQAVAKAREMVLTMKRHGDHGQKPYFREDHFSGGRTLYLLDVVRERCQLPDVKRKILSMAEAQRPEAVLIEEVGIGTALLQELRQDKSHGIGHNFVGCKLEKDKLTRAMGMQTTFEAGRVLLPEEAPWLGDYKRELLGFPAGRHDDQVDSTSQFITWMKDHHTPIVVFTPPDFYEPSRWQIGDEGLLQRPSWMIQDLMRRW